MLRKLLVSLFVAVFSFPLSLGATSFVPECADSSYRTEQADLVVVAKLGGDPEVIDEAGTLSTRVPLEVESVEKGEVPEDGLVVSQPGGDGADGVRQEIPSLTLEWPEETTWHLALIANQDETYSLVCGEFGRTLPGEDEERQALPGFSQHFSGGLFGLEDDTSGAVELSDFIIFIIVLSVWSLIWKGFALWHAARNKQKAWFVVMLIINTAGILEILYLLFWRGDKRTQASDDQRSVK